MREYWRKIKYVLWESDISILYVVMGALMFGASVIQIDDIEGKADPALSHPVITVWLCVFLGLYTIFIAPMRDWFHTRNTIMGFCFFLSLYLISDAWVNIMKGANGVWFIALIIYGFLFARSQKDVSQDNKQRKEDKKQC